MRRLYRFLLALLPHGFDRRDRTEMLAHYDRRVSRARRLSGRIAGAGTALFELADLAVAVARERTPTGLGDSILQDVRFGGRMLRRTPLVSALAVLSLALGIGATTAVFSTLDVWILRPLPFPDGDRLVYVAMANRERGWEANPFSGRDFLEWRAEARSVELAAYRPDAANVSVEGGAERIDVVRASANLLDVLRIAPRLGRGFSDGEERSGGPRAVLLSDAFWRTGMGADPGVLGRTVVLGGVEHAVVGVLPPRASRTPFRGDLWVPLRLSADAPRAGHGLTVVGRLRDGVTPAAARGELEDVADRVALRDPERTFPDAAVQPFRDFVYGDLFRQAGLVLGASVLFVLLIACANIANLLLARSLGRTHETAVRGALGAGRGRLARQLLTESAILAGLGGLLGLAVAHGGVELLLHVVLPRDVPGWEQIGLDGRVLAASAGLTLLAAVLSGLLPALRGSRVELVRPLTEGRGDDGAPGPLRLAKAVVVGEIALAVVLLAGTGLLVDGLTRLHGTDPGFRTGDPLPFRLLRPTADGSETFQRRVLEELAGLPGTGRVAAASGPPVGRWSTALYEPAAAAAGEGRGRRSAENRVVSPGYREVMGLGLLAGRWFSDEIDVRGAPAAAVVSRPLAEAVWGGSGEAVGERLLLSGQELVVVGVVEAGRLRGAHQPPPPVVFRSLTQFPGRALFYVVETPGDADGVLGRIRDRIRTLDPTVALDRPLTLEALVRETLGPQRAALRILGSLAAVALVLTLVGVYGVTAHTVGRRRREMGLRMALGADGSHLLRRVLGRSLAGAALGSVIGAGLSLPVGRVLASALQGVEAGDPGVLGLVTGLMIGAVLLASYVPARRAVRVDPVDSLRHG